MSKGYLFLTMTGWSGASAFRRVASPLSVTQMTKDLRSYAATAGMRRDFSVQSFRSESAISYALAGETLASITRRLEITGNYQRILRRAVPTKQ